MTMTVNDDGLCTWSDLPPEQCAHCSGAQLDVDVEPVPRYPTRRAVAVLRVVYPVAYQEAAPTAGARPTPDHGPVDLVDYVTVLCDPTIHREPVTELRRNKDGTATYFTTHHRTTSPPLLEQLWSTIEASGSTEAGMRAGYASKPAARLDAIDTARDIERGVFAWLTRLGERPDSMTDTIAALRHLGALARAQDNPTRHELTDDIRTWWARATVLTGWESPAWAPDNTCPLCGARGTIRIRLEHRTAVCFDCHETWTPDTIGLLAEHIRTQNNDTQETA